MYLNKMCWFQLKKAHLIIDKNFNTLCMDTILSVHIHTLYVLLIVCIVQFLMAENFNEFDELLNSSKIFPVPLMFLLHMKPKANSSKFTSQVIPIKNCAR